MSPNHRGRAMPTAWCGIGRGWLIAGQAGGVRSRCGALAGPLNKGWGCRLTPHEQPGAPLCLLRWRFEGFTGICSVCCSRVDLKKKGDVRPFKTLCALSVCAQYS